MLRISRVLLLLSLLLVGCGQTSIIDHASEDRTALVIIGLSGNISWQTIETNDHHFHRYEYPDIKPKDVVLLPVTVGTRLEIKKLLHQSRKGEIDFTFPRSPRLKIYRNHIYYFGIIESFSDGNNVRARIRADIDQAVIEMAKAKYPDVFRNKPPVQFRQDDLDSSMQKIKSRF